MLYYSSYRFSPFLFYGSMIQAEPPQSKVLCKKTGFYARNSPETEKSRLNVGPFQEKNKANFNYGIISFNRTKYLLSV